MGRYKSNTGALVIAVIVILVCLVSITGATLALFTSDESDGKIGINATSGNIDIDIVDPCDKNTSLVGEVLNFVTWPTGTEEEVLFEPGALFYTEGFRVKNKGNIPINFIIYISDQNKGSEASREFAEGFEVWLTKDPNDRSSMIKLQQFDGSLKGDEYSDIYYLVFRMKESAGNKFQDKTYSGIGVTVCAVQGNAHIN